MGKNLFCAYELLVHRHVLFRDERRNNSPNRLSVPVNSCRLEILDGQRLKQGEAMNRDEEMTGCVGLVDVFVIVAFWVLVAAALIKYVFYGG